ncbi:DNA-binding NarL/FixJ family response regulator [Acetoanaerobium pronyense]|uniref:Stage 0 sporulation protein A homolog n=1 Tax=Acetoanaerobium pronyense TaxID=1482736 RepID=A0ABS4KIZ8_9FIRM|nr:response regulator transcription factor [Acetoanaerobium pronyense]MBP2027768.1 DNA-binding NarL/FixJ family response regulator [Acetoanaerobium pronyense]
MDKISILVIDDEAIIRSILTKGLGEYEDLEIVKSFNCGRKAIDFLEKNNSINIDVILLDLIMPEENGIEILKKIKSIYPNIKIIMLTSTIKSKYIMDSLDNNVDGYIYKDIDFDSLASKIRLVKSGIFYSDDIINEDIEKYKVYSLKKKKLLESFRTLTNRELEIIDLITKGKSNMDIANELFLSERTVKNHVYNILKKLELQDRTQVAITNLRYNITN